MIPAPQLILAQFSDSGASIIAVFNHATDFNGETSPSWPCSDLFNFTSAGKSISSSGYICSWLNYTSVEITFSSGTKTLPQINDTLVVVGLLRQSCISDPSLCGSRQSAVGQRINLVGPLNPPFPTVVLSTSPIVGLCSDVVLDASASYGNGVRAWFRITWVVNSQNNVTSITTLLNQISTVSFPITLPRNLFSSGEYNFSLTLENFFLQSSSASVSITVNGNPGTPLLSLLGQNSYLINPSTPLLLQVQGQISSCNGSSLPLVYSWKVYLNNAGINLPVPHNNDPRSYILPSYSLRALNTYTVVSTATSGRGGSASVNVSVKVVKGSVVANIQGGFSRSYPVNFELVLNASTSYDQDSQLSQLSYRWLCSRSNHTVSKTSCSINNFQNISSVAVLRLPAYSLATGYSYVFTVNVSSNDGRYGIASVTIDPTGVIGSQTVIVGSANYRINQQSSLTLSGRCVASQPCTSYWSVTGSGITPSLANISNTPIQRSFSLIQILQNVSFPLGIKAGSLSAGNIYTFQISSFLTGYPDTLSFAAITVIVSGPPTSGAVVSSPSNGTAQKTIFLLSSVGWASPTGDYPLQYDFAYQTSSSSVPLTLAFKSAKTSVSSTLAAGTDPSNFGVIIIGNAYSSFGAKSSATTTVVVVPNNFSISDLVTYVSLGVNSSLLSYNLDGTLTTINTASSYVTSIACGSSPTCLSLHRTECGPSTFPQTCGVCLPGYIGVSGSSNLPCKSSNQSWSTSICSVNGDCLYDSCSNHTCTVPLKACPGNCSFHGSCRYFDNYGNHLSQCFANSSGCQARCVCFSNYSGYSCNLGANDAALVDETVITICSTLSTVYGLQDFSSQLLSTLLSSLYMVFNAYDSLSVTALDTCFSTLNNISTIADNGYLDSESTINLFANLISDFTVSVAFRSNGSFSNSTQRRLLANNDTALTHGDQLSTSLTSMYLAVIQYMTDGQTAINISTDAVKASINRELLSQTAGSALAILDPAASTSPYIMLPPSGLEACAGFGSGYAHYSVMQWAVNPYSNSSALVSPLLRWTSSPTASSSSAPVPSTSVNTEYFVFIEYTQPLNLSVTTSAFENRTLPACVNHDNLGYFACPCQLYSYTDTNATFLCDSIESSLCPAVSFQRRLIEFTSNVGSTNVAEFGVITESLAAEFVRVNSSVVNFHAAKGVIAFISILLCLFAGGIWYFSRWDSLDRKNILYVAKAKTKKEAKNASNEVLIELRKRIDHAFLTGGLAFEDLDEDDTELDRRRKCWRRYFVIPDYLRNHKSLLVSGDFLVRMTQAVLRFHPFICFFVGKSMVRTRTLRFFLLIKSLMVSLFTSTLIFGTVTVS